MIAESFFDSNTWILARNMSGFLVAVFWLTTAFWVFKDARRRIADPWLVGMATVLGLVPPFVGPIVYLFLRPPDSIEERRDRDLDNRALEERLAERDLRCPVCRGQVDASFLVCPVCTTRLQAGVWILRGSARGDLAGLSVLRGARAALRGTRTGVAPATADTRHELIPRPAGSGCD